MRIYVILIFLAVGLAFSAGYLSLSIRNAPRTDQGSLSDIALLKTRFQRDHSPEIKLELPTLFYTADYSQLVDPAYEFSQNRRYPFKTLSTLYRYAQNCSSPASSRTTDPFLKKSWQWLEFKCGKLKRLPEGFFEKAPYTSALGGSFAELATLFFANDAIAHAIVDRLVNEADVFFMEGSSYPEHQRELKQKTKAK